MIFKKIVFTGHPILGDLNLNLCKETGEPYKIIIFVGENGCGKTTILNEIYAFNETRFISKEKSEFLLNAPLENGMFEAIYIRQDHKYCSVLDEISEKICSEKVFEIPQKNISGSANILNLRRNVNINSINYIKSAIFQMGNERLNDFVVIANTPNGFPRSWACPRSLFRAQRICWSAHACTTHCSRTRIIYGYK